MATIFDINAGCTIDGSGLIITVPGPGVGARSSIGCNKGKKYFEVTCERRDIGGNIGLCDIDNNLNTSDWASSSSMALGVYANYYRIMYGSKNRDVAFPPGVITNPGIAGIAIDFDAHIINYYYNGALLISEGYNGKLANIGAMIYPFTFSGGAPNNGVRSIQTWNFGLRPFKYPVPAGYKAWDRPNCQYLYMKNLNKLKEVYGMSNGVFTKLADNWSALTLAEKKALFVSTNYETATVANLQTLGKFKVLSYSETEDKPTIELSAVPKDQLILPRSLTDLSSYEDLTKSMVTAAVSGDSRYKALVTTDLKTYQAYINGIWQDVNHTDIEAVTTNSMDVTQLTNISREAWDKLLKGKAGIGFAYLPILENISDKCGLDKLEAVVDMKGKWDTITI